MKASTAATAALGLLGLLGLLGTPASLGARAALAGFEGELETREVHADLDAIRRVAPDADPDDTAAIAAVPPDRFVADGGAGVRVQTGKMTLKGAWGRTDMDDPGIGGFMLMNFEEGDAYMCRGDERRCLRFTQEDRKAAEARAAKVNEAMREAMNGQDPASDQDARPPVVVEDTGRTETAGGASAQVYKASSGGDVAFAWMTTQLPEISAVYRKALELFERSSRNGGFAARSRHAMASRGLPMRVQLVETARGRTVYRSNEITAYRAKPVEETLVRPPAGWEIKSRAQMAAEAARGPAHSPSVQPPSDRLPPPR